ncbi:MAG: hypothetical protein AABX90_02505 [Nanoarchaeota archaeon]
MNKKGFIGAVFAAPWFIILFFFALFVFFIIFTIVIPFIVNDEIKGEIEDSSLSFSLINFFRMQSSKGNVHDLFYYYMKNSDAGLFDEIRTRMREFLDKDVCIEVLVNEKTISGEHFNDCGEKQGGVVGVAIKLTDNYEFLNFDKEKVKVNFYRLNINKFWLRQIRDPCSFLDKNQCLNWVGCVLEQGECKNG